MINLIHSPGDQPLPYVPTLLARVLSVLFTVNFGFSFFSFLFEGPESADFGADFWLI